MLVSRTKKVWHRRIMKMMLDFQTLTNSSIATVGSTTDSHQHYERMYSSHSKVPCPSTWRNDLTGHDQPSADETSLYRHYKIPTPEQAWIGIALSWRLWDVPERSAPKVS